MDRVKIKIGTEKKNKRDVDLLFIIYRPVIDFGQEIGFLFRAISEGTVWGHEAVVKEAELELEASLEKWCSVDLNVLLEGRLNCRGGDIAYCWGWGTCSYNVPKDTFIKVIMPLEDEIKKVLGLRNILYETPLPVWNRPSPVWGKKI